MILVNVGEMLAGKYRVDRVLGIGGMGMVVAATDVSLDRRVALKFMLPDALRDPAAADRFLREAKAAAKLNSEHVCRVLEVGRLTSGAPYIVMEFMEGIDFGEVLTRYGALPVPDAVDYVMQALEGVAEAHANRIVHRDLKPANLFVLTDSDGSPLVKVLDFGISKSSTGSAATKTGEIMGSPAYMAPEQMMSSKHVDVRADVWALGVILYQAVTGRLPFEGDTLPALCMAVMGQQPVPVSAIRTNIPPTFNAVVMRCLEKEIDKRFTDVGALAAALAPFGRSEAAVSSARITKVLRRGTGAAPILAPVETPAQPRVADTLVSGSHADTPPTPLRAAAPASTPPPPRTPVATQLSASSAQHLPVSAVGQDSTLRGSAGAMSVSQITAAESTAASRSRRRIIALAAGGGVAVTAIVVVLATKRSEPTIEASTHASTSMGSAVTVTPIPDATNEAPVPPPSDLNHWVTIEPPPTTVVLGVGSAGTTDRGFRATRNVAAPRKSYQIQQHEVTWAEVDAWLEKTKQSPVAYPAWATDRAARARLPATGLAWTQARQYCKSIGATLPTEEQWEYAARGAELRANPWGQRRIDLSKVHAYAGSAAVPAEVMSSEQDRTAGADRLFDMAGNVQEWTEDLWREDSFKSAEAEAWVQRGTTSFRAIRGLPLAADPPDKLQTATAAYRDVLCATGECLDKAQDAMKFVGFRCAIGSEYDVSDLSPVPGEPAGAVPDGAPSRTTAKQASNDKGRAEATAAAEEERKRHVAAETEEVGGCDEVSCVLNNYEGRCCAKFKKAKAAREAGGGGGASNLPDSLDRSMISEGIGNVKARVTYCGDKSPAKGKVKVKVAVGGDGYVSNVSVETTPDPALGACVAAAVQKARFTRTQNGGSFSYPFVF